MCEDESKAKARRLSELESVDVTNGKIKIRMAKNAKGGKASPDEDP